MRFVVAEIYVIRDLNDNGVVMRRVRPQPPPPPPRHPYANAMFC